MQLNYEQLADLLQHRSLNALQHFASIDSTNQWLLTQGQCGQFCLADQQTAGRGRQGKTWHSASTDNLYLSLKHCFVKPVTHLSLLSLAVGIALAEALAELGLQNHQLKWPNDVYVQQKKLAGILLESNAAQTVVIGMGLNRVSDFTQQQKGWTSLQSVMSEPPNATVLLATIINHLDELLSAFPNDSPRTIQTKWANWDMLAGQPINLTYAGKSYQGLAQGINHQGELGLLVDNQPIRYFSSAVIDWQQKD
ncbi:MAG: biotin--[acetyl-CoA-carboxylase] ligase [bacterium]